jgi:hypothetical protein
MNTRETLLTLKTDVDQALQVLDRLTPVLEAYRPAPAAEPAATAEPKAASTAQPKPARAKRGTLTEAERKERRRAAKKAWYEQWKAMATQQAQGSPPASEDTAPASDRHQGDVAHEAPAAQDDAVPEPAPVNGNGRPEPPAPKLDKALLASCSSLAALAPSEQHDVVFAAAGLKDARPETVEQRLAGLAPGRYRTALEEVLNHSGCFR